MRRRAVTRRLRRGLLLVVALLASGVAVAIESGGVWERGELGTVDTRFAIRGERPPPPELVVVAIDDVTFDELEERWPFSRRRFAEALDAISADKPKLIVYDVQFTEASGDTEEDVAADNALVEASRRARNVIYSTTEVAEDGTTRVFGGRDGQEYARATVGNGLLPEDPGGVLRRLPLEVDGVRTLAVAAAQRLGVFVDREALSGGGTWIDFTGPPRHVTTIPFSRVVQDRARPGAFKDKVVVIGASAPSLQDRHATSWKGESMAGPEIHANAIGTLLNGIPLRSSASWVDLVLAIGLSILAPLLGRFVRPGLAFASAAGAGVAYAVSTQVAFQHGRILPVVAPLLGLSVGLVGSLGVHYLTATVERAQVRDLFSRFVPDSVVNQVLEKAGSEDPRLGGARLVSTVMFSDLRGFTSFAESRSPEEVIDVLNRYLTLMSDAILDHGGTLVAYMGDGIMAVFGAPIGSDDHADRALAAGRAMLDRMEEFNAWMRDNGHGDGFKMGIGLNTGGVMSGNVGSARRLEYTAIGDTTNTAARLEGMTKGTDYQLFLGGSTYEALSAKGDDLEFVDELEVRGRQAKLPVWGLRPSTGSVEGSS